MRVNRLKKRSDGKEKRGNGRGERYAIMARMLSRRISARTQVSPAPVGDEPIRIVLHALERHKGAARIMEGVGVGRHVSPSLSLDV